MKIPQAGHVEVVHISTQCHKCREKGKAGYIPFKLRKGTERTFGTVYRNDHGSRCQTVHERCLDCGAEHDSLIDYDCLAAFFPASPPPRQKGARHA